MKKEFMRLSGIGDLDEDYFVSPTQRNRNLTNVKNGVKNLRKKYELLTQNKEQLKKRVESLNNVPKELKNKSLISENPAINKKVRCNILCNV